MIEARHLPWRLRAAGLAATAAMATGTSTPMLHAQEPRALRITEITRMGGDPAGVEFTEIRFAALAPETAIVIGQPRDANLLVVSASGDAIRTIGRSGSGPGEFRVPGRVGVLPGDTIWAIEQRLMRAMWFSRDGSLLREATCLSGIGLGERALLPASILASGHILAVQRTASEPSSDGAARRTFGLFDPTCRSSRVLGELYSANSRLVTPPPLVFFLEQPFADHDLIASSTDGARFAIVDRRVRSDVAPRFAVTVYGQDGSISYTRSYPYKPSPITSEAWNEVLESYEAAVIQTPGRSATRAPPEWAAAAQARVYRPAHQPPVRALLVDRSGRVWLDRAPPSAKQGRWLVLDAIGQPLGLMTMPENITPLDAVGDLMIARSIDSLGVHQLVLYRVTGL